MVRRTTSEGWEPLRVRLKEGKVEGFKGDYMEVEVNHRLPEIGSLDCLWRSGVLTIVPLSVTVKSEEWMDVEVYRKEKSGSVR